MMTPQSPKYPSLLSVYKELQKLVSQIPQTLPENYNGNAAFEFIKEQIINNKDCFQSFTNKSKSHETLTEFLNAHQPLAAIIRDINKSVTTLNNDQMCDDWKHIKSKLIEKWQSVFILHISTCQTLEELFNPMMLLSLNCPTPEPEDKIFNAIFKTLYEILPLKKQEIKIENINIMKNGSDYTYFQGFLRHLILCKNLTMENYEKIFTFFHNTSFSESEQEILKEDLKAFSIKYAHDVMVISVKNPSKTTTDFYKNLESLKNDGNGDEQLEDTLLILAESYIGSIFKNDPDNLKPELNDGHDINSHKFQNLLHYLTIYSDINDDSYYKKIFTFLKKLKFSEENQGILKPFLEAFTAKYINFVEKASRENLQIIANFYKNINNIIQTYNPDKTLVEFCLRLHPANNFETLKNALNKTNNIDESDKIIAEFCNCEPHKTLLEHSAYFKKNLNAIIQKKQQDIKNLWQYDEEKTISDETICKNILYIISYTVQNNPRTTIPGCFVETEIAKSELNVYADFLNSCGTIELSPDNYKQMISFMKNRNFSCNIDSLIKPYQKIIKKYIELLANDNSEILKQWLEESPFVLLAQNKTICVFNAPDIYEYLYRETKYSLATFKTKNSYDLRELNDQHHKMISEHPSLQKNKFFQTNIANETKKAENAFFDTLFSTNPHNDETKKQNIREIILSKNVENNVGNIDWSTRLKNLFKSEISNANINDINKLLVVITNLNWDQVDLNQINKFFVNEKTIDANGLNLRNISAYVCNLTKWFEKQRYVDKLEYISTFLQHPEYRYPAATEHYILYRLNMKIQNKLDFLTTEFNTLIKLLADGHFLSKMQNHIRSFLKLSPCYNNAFLDYYNTCEKIKTHTQFAILEPLIFWLANACNLSIHTYTVNIKAISKINIPAIVVNLFNSTTNKVAEHCVDMIKENQEDLPPFDFCNELLNALITVPKLKKECEMAAENLTNSIFQVLKNHYGNSLSSSTNVQQLSFNKNPQASPTRIWHILTTNGACKNRQLFVQQAIMQQTPLFVPKNSQEEYVKFRYNYALIELIKIFEQQLQNNKNGIIISEQLISYIIDYLNSDGTYLCLPNELLNLIDRIIAKFEEITAMTECNMFSKLFGYSSDYTIAPQNFVPKLSSFETCRNLFSLLYTLNQKQSGCYKKHFSKLDTAIYNIASRCYKLWRDILTKHPSNEDQIRIGYKPALTFLQKLFRDDLYCTHSSHKKKLEELKTDYNEPRKEKKSKHVGMAKFYGN